MSYRYKGGIIIENSSAKKEPSYDELKRIVARWGNNKAKKQLKLLLEETNWDFEPHDLTKLITDSKNGRAIEELVALMSTKPAMGNHLSLILQNIVEIAFSSITPKYFTELTTLRNMVRNAIQNQYRKPS